MTDTVPPIPEGFSTVTPFLTAQGADKLIDFLKEAFDAQELFLLRDPEGTVWHAQMQIGDAKLMVGDTMGQHPPQSAMLYLYVEDAKAAYDKAVRAGAISIAPVQDHFYGDRAGGVRDIFGNVWWLAQRIEAFDADEIKRRAATEYEKKKKAAA